MGNQPNQDLPGEKKVPSKEERREGEYVAPDDDSAISPGAHPGTIAPTEDPRKDAGLEPEEGEAQPKE